MPLHIINTVRTLVSHSQRGNRSLAGTMNVVKLNGPPQLCKTDEVGELCLSAPYAGTAYWGLHGISNSTFKVQDSLFRHVTATTFVKI